MTVAELDTRVQDVVGKTGKLLIDGNWVEAASGKTFETFDPATEQMPRLGRPRRGRGRRPRGRRRAPGFDDERSDWRRMTPSERGRIIHRIGDLILEHADELAMLEIARQRQAVRDRARPRTCRWPPTSSTTWRAGRPRSRATRPDLRAHRARVGVPRLHAARAGRRRRPDHPVELPAADGGVEARPGAGGRRAPWCSSPPSRRRCRRCASASSCRRPGCPHGVVNIVTGFGDAGAALAAQRRRRQGRLHRLDRGRQADRAGRGGQPQEGHARARRQEPATSSTPTPTCEAAIAGAANGIFFNHGQCCNAGSRLYIEKDVFDEVVAGVADEAEKIKVGPGTDADTQMGPLISDEQFDKVLGYLSLRRRRRRAGGRRRRPRGRPRVLRPADRAHQHHARHEGRPRGDLRPGGVRDPVRLRGRRSSPTGQRHQLRPRRRGLDARHLKAHRTAAPPARRHGVDQHATTCSTPRCRSAATRSRAGAARWATQVLDNYLETKSVVTQLA